MIEFEKKKHHWEIIHDCGRYIGDLSDYMGEWSFDQYSTGTESNALRAIADKLDELNGEESEEEAGSLRLIEGSKDSIPRVVDSKVMLLLGHGGQFKSIQIEDERGSVATIDAFGKCTWKDTITTPVTDEALLEAGAVSESPNLVDYYRLSINPKTSCIWINGSWEPLESMEHLAEIASALRIELKPEGSAE